VEPLEFLDADPQVVVVLRMSGRMHAVEVDEVWSQLWTFRDAKAVLLHSFTSPDGAREAAGLSE
jgi:hypothetical protein